MKSNLKTSGSRSLRRVLAILVIQGLLSATAAVAATQGPPAGGPPGPPGQAPGAGPPGSGPPGNGPPPGGDFAADFDKDFEKGQAANRPPPQVPLPPPPKDRRNLEGTYLMSSRMNFSVPSDIDGAPVPQTAEGKKILDRRNQAMWVERTPFSSPGTLCYPPGLAWMAGIAKPFKILQTSDAVIFSFSELHDIWGVSLTGQREGAATYKGDAIGHWEGDTLVVANDNFKQRLWLDATGTPVSKDAHLTFRIRRTDEPKEGPGLEIVTTVDDPQMFTRPWSFKYTYSYRPDMEVFLEFNCEGATVDAGFKPEPKEY